MLKLLHGLHRGFKSSSIEEKHGVEVISRLREILRGLSRREDLVYTVRISGEVVHLKNGKHRWTLIMNCVRESMGYWDPVAIALSLPSRT